MDHHLIWIPYDSGHRNARMGAGPSHLINHGALQCLEHFGHVTSQVIEARSSFPTEIGTAFELHHAGAAAVEVTLRQGARPIVLSGNCNSSLGTVAGIQRVVPDDSLGVIWFDGHGDCNTPETFDGDFLDAMGLSTLTGRCWQTLAGTVAGFRPIHDENIVLVGGHGADAGARLVLSRSAINVVPPQVDPLLKMAAATEGLRDRGVTKIYLHLDLDVLDPASGRANEFAPAGGFNPDILLSCIELIVDRMAVSALAVTSFDPTQDHTGRVTDVALQVISAVARARGVELPRRG